MTIPTIRLAHSKHKHGFTVYSHESYPSARYGVTKAGYHTTSEETLPDAMARARAKIRGDWQHLAESPAIIDCGRVADITGKNHTF